MSDAYQECLAFLHARLNYERVGMPRSASDLRIARTRRLLRRLGDPQVGLPLVHVAGTKGKGSCAAMIAAALGSSGRPTGLSCSPHIHRLEERFTVDGQPASEAEFVALTEGVRPIVEAIDRESGTFPLTFFEVTTAMALLHFARRGAKAAVLEVGLGGRLDSTNAIRPRVSMITSISFDHMRLLGNTLGQIATEKAGIIKRRTPVVSGVTGDEARHAIARVARQRLATLRSVRVDFDHEYAPPRPPIVRPTAGALRVQTWRKDWGWLDVPLLGRHQAHNVATSLATLDVLAETGLEVTPDQVAAGFAGLKWPARVEILGRRPWLVIDGAHNAASAEALSETIRTCLPPGPRTLVFGTTREKDLDGQLRALVPQFERVIVTQYVENPRALPPAEVAAAFSPLDLPEPIQVATPAESLTLAREITPTEGLICVTGSLFLAAEVRALLLGVPVVPVSHPLTA
jgi:dihydrofolate synthase/folylpolyglutamate synthase